jgi:hypothetical protein
VVGDEEDQPEDAEDGDTANPTSGEVGAGDTGDEDDIQGNDGEGRIADLDGAIDQIVRRREPVTEDRFKTLERALAVPETAIGVAYAMALLNGRTVEKLEPKGSASATGTEPVRVSRVDFRRARNDFNYRQPGYAGILEAEAVAGDDE